MTSTRARLDFPPDTEPMSALAVYSIIAIVGLTVLVIVCALGRMIAALALS